MRASRVDLEISVADRHSEWIPFTDHRDIVAQIVPVIPGSLLSNSRAPFRVPIETEKHKY